MKAAQLVMQLPTPYRQRARRVIFRCANSSLFGHERSLYSSESYEQIYNVLYSIECVARNGRVTVPESPSFWSRLRRVLNANCGSVADARYMRLRGIARRLPGCPPTLRYASTEERRFCEV